MWAVDARDGIAGDRRLWSRNIGDSDSSIAFSSAARTSIFVGTNAGRVYHIDPSSGATCWASTSDGCPGTAVGAEQFFCADATGARATSCNSGSAIRKGIAALNGAYSNSILFRSADGVDLLMMVDNSNSMGDEQVALKAQFPKLINVLTTGYRSEDDLNPFPPVKDLHVGVVSSDMGIPGVEPPPNCDSNGGDDGRLQNTPHGENCDAEYPLWLSFIGDGKIGEQTESNKFANDVGCIATLGTGGCGFEQQLDSPFKALMPKLLEDATGKVSESPFRFLATERSRTYGRGDLPVAQGGNLGFLRNSLSEGLSLIAILIVTDEEDCSVQETQHLKRVGDLPEGDPARDVDINLRCFTFKENLYDLEKRYFNGFRALRPGNENLIVFAAIVGFP